MTHLHLIILGIVQGITEFLPISSSAHLILVPQFLGDVDQGLMVDVGAHAGTLLAVVLVFWRETLQLVRGSWDTVRLRPTWDARLTQYLALATIPGVIAGVALVDYQEALLRHIPVIIGTNVVWGLALYWADKTHPQDKTIQNDLSWGKAFVVGCLQALALVPGTSRSGITMTGWRYFGFARLEAAKLSLMMSIPITAGAVAMVIIKLIKHPPSPDELMQFYVVAGLSFVTALAAIFGLLRWLKRFNFTPFVVYRLGLAVFLTIWYLQTHPNLGW